MKTFLLKLSLVLLLAPVMVTAQPSDRPSVGLVLSGGGAKGLAHIGVLKMLDSLQIPVDYIAGTSMGGIVGALYAIGYSAKEIELIAQRQDWDELFSDSPPRKYLSIWEKEDDSRFQFSMGLKGFTPVTPSGFIQGQKISLQLSSLTLSAEYIKDFDDFYIPFRCVAVDLVSGKEVVLKKGSVSKAMRATMSIPTIFAPVEWGDSLLIDGGAYNNLPVDVVKDMGAEFIISVDVGDFQKDRNELKSMLNVLEQTFNIPLKERIDRNRQMSNLLITPDTKKFASSDFSKNTIQEIMQEGDKAAREFCDALTIAKYQYHLYRRDPDLEILEVSRPSIFGISITGNNTIPWKELYDLIELKPGDIFDYDSFQKKIADIRLSGHFADLNYEIRPVNDTSIRLNIDVQEKQDPKIFGIYIDGNELIPFKLIYNMLGVKVRQKLDIPLLHKRINELYGLGYFDTITYEVEPASNGFIKLFIHVKEKNQQVVQIGLHYDDYYKLVASLGIRLPNFIIPGVQLKSLFEFSGRTRIDLKMLYPFRSEYISMLPYINFIYKDYPITIYTGEGDKIASYLDRSSSPGLGIKFWLGRFGSIDVGLNNEYVLVEPDIAFPDPVSFPSWHDELHLLQTNFVIDSRDDAILPHNGMYLTAQYEKSLKPNKSELIYNRYSLDGKFYYSIAADHTLRFSGFYGWCSDKTPVYKYYYTDGPETYVGFEYFQLYGLNYGIARVDYRYMFKRDIYFKLIYNVARNFYGYPAEMRVAEYIDGWGVGIKFLSILGPLEIIYSRGRRSVQSGAKMRDLVYLKAGFEL